MLGLSDGTGWDIIAAASYPHLIRICLSNGSKSFGGKGCFDVLLFAFRFWTLEMFLKREIEREREREERRENWGGRRERI